MTQEGRAFELLGVDVLPDGGGRDGAPCAWWLMELQREPSLQPTSPLDARVKTALIRGLEVPCNEWARPGEGALGVRGGRCAVGPCWVRKRRVLKKRNGSCCCLWQALLAAAAEADGGRVVPPAPWREVPLPFVGAPGGPTGGVAHGAVEEEEARVRQIIAYERLESAMARMELIQAP